MGMNVQPLGMLVITADEERWVPVLDITRIVIASSAVLITGLLTLRKIYGGGRKWRQRRRWEG